MGQKNWREGLTVIAGVQLPPPPRRSSSSFPTSSSLLFHPLFNPPPSSPSSTHQQMVAQCYYSEIANFLQIKCTCLEIFRFVYF